MILEYKKLTSKNKKRSLKCRCTRGAKAAKSAPDIVHQRHETMHKSAPEILIQCACKDLFWTFKFFTIKEEVLNFSKKGLLGEMTMAHFNIEPKNRCSRVTSISWQLRKELPTAGRHATQTLIGKDLKSKFT